MNPQHAIGDSAELAALYVVGALAAAEHARFEAHLRGGCEACLSAVRELQPVEEALLAAAAELAPPAEIRASLVARVGLPSRTEAGSNPQVWKMWREQEGHGLHVVRAGSGGWEETAVHGVSVRRLSVDPERNQFTALVPNGAGAAYPRHRHDGPEECLVLEGDLHVGDDVLHAGDYQRADEESLHGIQSTENGCLLLIVSSLTDELIQRPAIQGPAQIEARGRAEA